MPVIWKRYELKGNYWDEIVPEIPFQVLFCDFGKFIFFFLSSEKLDHQVKQENKFEKKSKIFKVFILVVIFGVPKRS